MKIVFFDSKPYDIEFFNRKNEHGHLKFEFKFHESRLNEDTASLAKGFDAVCLFVNDKCDAEVLSQLLDNGIRHIFMRCAGYDRVDLAAALSMGISVQRVPAYSPHAVAEFATGLLLTLNRRIHLAYNRVRDGNFTLNGFDGFDLHGKTVGVVGTGKIGQCFIDIMIGFGARILAFDAFPNQEYAAKPQVEYVCIERLFRKSDVISLHVPLLDSTHQIINEETLKMMKPNAILVNTSRGGLVKTSALVNSLKRREIGGAALDVYEEEEGYFFEDRSAEVILDDTLARLQNMRNAIITSHQAFFTKDALSAIADVTLQNARACQELEDRHPGATQCHHDSLPNIVSPPAELAIPPLMYLQSRNMAYGTRRASFIESHLAPPCEKHGASIEK